MKSKFTFFTIILLSILTLQSQSKKDVLQNIINDVNIDSLKYFVEELSGVRSTIINGSPYTITSRHKNSAGNAMAADYIKQKLASYGLDTYDQNFSSTGRNVYGVQLGTTMPN